MQLLEETKQLCNLYGIKPSRSRGQNFLINEDVYKKIIDAADLKKTDVVLEVGPGLGFLTKLLGENVKQVVAVELDRKLAQILPDRLKSQGVDNIKVIQTSILDFKGLDGEYKVLSNLPYNITSIFLRKFLEINNKPTSLTLMLQKEVAERIVAKPGDMSLLGLSVQFYAEAKLIAQVSRHDFWPEPAVDSAIIKIIVRNKNFCSLPDTKIFFRLAKIGFSAKRKMLKNNLAAGLKIDQLEIEKILKSINIKPTARAQDLGVKEWLELYRKIENF